MKAQAQKGFTLIELMIVVAIIGILAAIAIPQYQTYVAKSQVQRAVAESGAIKTAIEACILENKLTVGIAAGNCDPQATGSSILVGPTQGNPIPADTGVPQVTIPNTGLATIVATFGNKAATALSSGPGSVTWRRDANGSWTCQAAGIDTKYTATSCPL
ncbi:type IV pilus assembly protein PilA [Ectopseudomonas chengduensis]|uniref:Pilin n=1 Tax=Ectopseudomonas chengduensis TaxID=489632 RepID=A0A1G6SBC0_9GAMM|nr:pilin [Pseudomonas chengduensis]MBP3064513.1 prepilin-type N-terminal cleavage/methylation domain-containing protein [Pseudomonas chengduensis]NNB76357.1 pilin [Pseudomonas chengduensis]SDD14033.1 type IV pilus assembly protein PilA [Pseudomonas chengduensis]